MHTGGEFYQMKITLLKNYGLSATGDSLDVSKPIADLLIGRNVAKISESKKIKVDKIKGQNNGKPK